MKIFETHAHYDDEAFREDREALFDEMFANDIDTIINVGASFAGCEQSVALADSHEKIYAAVGIHPEDVEELTEARMAWLKKTASENEKGARAAEREKVRGSGRNRTGLPLPGAGKRNTTAVVPQTVKSRGRCKKNGDYPFTGSLSGHACLHEGRTCRTDWRRDSLLFVFQRSGTGIFKNGLLLRFWWCCDV